MNTEIINSQFRIDTGKSAVLATHKKMKPFTVSGFKLLWVALRVRYRILSIAWNCYGSLSTAIETSRKLAALTRAVYGGEHVRRCIKLNGKYYFGFYIPGFPSQIFDSHIRTELNYIKPHKKAVNRLHTLQLAVTCRCPLKCEHCFEWENLNKLETFTDEELAIIIKKFQEAGCEQFHITGGEPMIKMARLKRLVKTAQINSEFYVLTSGLNVTQENVKILKQVGVTGIIISLDHFDPAMHNIFRGSAHAFDNALNAAYYAHEAGLVTGFSLCLTKSFVSEENLFKYTQLARDYGVAFVQLLEPKPVGHYEGRDVTLGKEQTDILEQFYLKLNYSKDYFDYPLIIYHGFHHRRLGCFAAGDRVLYIDSAGFVDACPFCQTKSYHANQIVSGELPVSDININRCPVYKKISNMKSAHISQ